MTLTDGEKNSPVWLKLKEHMEHLLEIERKKNDDLPTLELTWKCRGRIANLKDLLKLVDEPKT